MRSATVRTWPVAVFTAVALTAVTGCRTTISSTVSSTPASVTTTTVRLPADTPTQLREMVRLTTGLGNLVANGGAGPVVDHINALWTLAAASVGPKEPRLRQDIDVQIATIQVGVKYRRAADEDKAATNLGAIVDTYLQRHPAG
jgi:hypothetical protein